MDSPTTPTGCRLHRPALAFWLLLVCSTREATAQMPVSTSSVQPATTSQAPSRFRAHALDAGVNVGLGALTAGIIAWKREESLWRGLVYGALGGGVAFAGKELVAQEFSAAGLLGRELSAFGASIVSNASYGRAPLDRIVLPIGFLRLYFNADDSSRTRIKLDLAATLAFLYSATQPRARLDLRSSLSSGAFVFDGIAPRSLSMHKAGTLAGVIRLTYFLEPEEREGALAHETIHAAQYDFSFLVWSEPAERALWKLFVGGERIHRYVDLGLNVPIWGVLNTLIPYDDRPWEREAFLLTGAR